MKHLCCNSTIFYQQDKEVDRLSVFTFNLLSMVDGNFLRYYNILLCRLYCLVSYPKNKALFVK